MGMFDSLGGIVMGLGSAYGQARRAKRGMPAGGGLLTQYLAQQQEEEELARKQKMIEDERNARMGEFQAKDLINSGNPIDPNSELVTSMQSLGYNTAPIVETSQDSFFTKWKAPMIQMYSDYGIELPGAINTADNVQSLMEAMQTTESLEARQKLLLTITAMKQLGTSDAMHALASLSPADIKDATNTIQSDPVNTMTLIAGGLGKHYDKVMSGSKGGGGNSGGDIASTPGVINFGSQEFTQLVNEWSKDYGLDTMQKALTVTDSYASKVGLDETNGANVLQQYVSISLRPKIFNLMDSSTGTAEIRNPENNRDKIIQKASQMAMVFLQSTNAGLTYDDMAVIASNIGTDYFMARSAKYKTIITASGLNVSKEEASSMGDKIKKNKQAVLGLIDTVEGQGVLEGDWNLDEHGRAKLTPQELKEWVNSYEEQEAKNKTEIAAYLAYLQKLITSGAVDRQNPSL